MILRHPILTGMLIGGTCWILKDESKNSTLNTICNRPFLIASAISFPLLYFKIFRTRCITKGGSMYRVRCTTQTKSNNISIRKINENKIEII